MAGSTRDGARRTMVVPGVLIALVALGFGALLWATGGAGQGVRTTRPTAEQTTLFLGEMRENLDGHPDRPRYDLVAAPVLVREGVTACQWLATQPTGAVALVDDQLRDRYFRSHPRTGPDWPFEQGRTGLREELLTNAWWRLCPAVEANHVGTPRPSDED